MILFFPLLVFSIFSHVSALDRCAKPMWCLEGTAVRMFPNYAHYLEGNQFKWAPVNVERGQRCIMLFQRNCEIRLFAEGVENLDIPSEGCHYDPKFKWVLCACESASYCNQQVSKFIPIAKKALERNEENLHCPDQLLPPYIPLTNCSFGRIHKDTVFPKLKIN